MRDAPLTPQDIFHQALDFQSAADRDAFLDRACAANAELRHKVVGLIQAHEQMNSKFMEPVARLAGNNDTPADRHSGDTPNNSAAEDRTDFHLPSHAIGNKSDRSGEQIGPYALIRQLGEGGMGAVYLAQKGDRQVALKIISTEKYSNSAIARFKAEREAMALMDHPNIATVFDADITDEGEPYFVMELVRDKSSAKAKAFVNYCKEHRLTIRQRLELFEPVCLAVQHAHSQGFIHRDLKPSNVLVGETKEGKPIPKVIDFGLAKSLEQPLSDDAELTSPGQVMGTLAYMSPEQASGEKGVGTSTDLYSLGVMLYELLTDELPINLKTSRDDFFLTVKRIREEIPLAPSARVAGLKDQLLVIAAERQIEPPKLCSLLRGELDWITLKALEKAPASRYRHASELADDIRRYLNREPVIAGPQTWPHLAKKFIRKNRALVLMSCVGFVSVAVALAGLGLGWLNAEEAKVKEMEAKNRARSALVKQRDAFNIVRSGIHLRMYEKATLTEPEKAVLLNMLEGFRRLLDLAPDATEDERCVVAEASSQVADLNTRLGLDDALESRRVAISHYESLAADFPNNDQYRNELARCYFDLAHLFRSQGKTEEAAHAFSRSIELDRSIVAQFPKQPAYWRELADGYNDYGVLLKNSNRPQEAEKAFREAILLGEEVVVQEPNQERYKINLAVSYHNLGNMERDRGQLKEAVEIYRKAMALLLPLVRDKGEISTDAARFLMNARWDRAIAREQLGLDADAIRDWDAALEIDDKYRFSEGDHIKCFLSACQMRMKLKAEPMPSASLLYDAAVINARAQSTAIITKEKSLEAAYSRRTLALLNQARTGGFFTRKPAVDTFKKNADFERLPAVEYQSFLASLEADLKARK